MTAGLVRLAALRVVRLHFLERLCPFQGVWCANLACVGIS